MAGKRRTSRAVTALIIAAIFVVALAGASAYWLRKYPQHNPWAPLSLTQPIGWATGGKLVALRDDLAQCRTLLRDADVRYRPLPVVGEGACRAADRTVIVGGQGVLPLTPAGAGPSCAVSAGMVLWQREVMQPMARLHLGRQVVRMEHLGSYNCRRIAGSDSYSQHANGNAIDISAFVLSDGRRVSLIDDWDAPDGRSAFLRSIRDGACPLFSTVLSPDFNRAHADHFHFDQAERIMGRRVCR